MKSIRAKTVPRLRARVLVPGSEDSALLSSVADETGAGVAVELSIWLGRFGHEIRGWDGQKIEMRGANLHYPQHIDNKSVALKPANPLAAQTSSMVEDEYSNYLLKVGPD